MFIDVRMPGMSGPELAEAVRQLRSDIRIVRYVGEEAVLVGLPFVPKPWRMDQVARAVDVRRAT